MSVAAITMVWQDTWFLERWVGYFGEALGRENLYVVLHGEDAEARAVAVGCNILVLPREEFSVDFDDQRWRFLNQLTNGLLNYFDTVLCLDVDEFIVPVVEGKSLAETLGALPQDQNWALAGFELFPEDPENTVYTSDSRIIDLCPNGLFAPFYSKSCIARTAVDFSPGAHGLYGDYASLTEDLVLFHLRFVNPAELDRRRTSRKRIANEAYATAGTNAEEMRRSGALVSWSRAGRRHGRVFREYEETAPQSFENGLAEVLEQLPRLRFVHEGRYQFRPTAKTPVRVSLPDWMRSVF